MAQNYPKNFASQQIPLSPVENMMTNISTPGKTPVKHRAISSHMLQNKATYSQPCSTIIFSPVKPPNGCFISPLELRTSMNQSLEDKDGSLAYKLQNDKMGQILKDKELMIFELRNKLKEYEVYKAEKDQNSAALVNLERKINDVLNENQRLNQLLMDRETPIKLSQNINENISQLLSENEKLNGIVKEMQAAIDSKNQENLAIRELLEEKIRESEVFNDLIRKSEALIIENEKLNTMNKQYVKEMDTWKQKFLQIEKALNNVMGNSKKEENLALTKEIETLFNENVSLKEKIKILMEENRKLNDFFSNYQREKEDVLRKKQDKSDLLTQELQNLKTEAEEKDASFAVMKEKMNLLLAENSKLNRLFLEKNTSPGSSRRNDYQQQMSELQNKLEVMIEENEKLNLIIEEKNNALEHAKVEEFLKINEKLKKSLVEKRQEADMWRKKFQEIVKE